MRKSVKQEVHKSVWPSIITCQEARAVVTKKSCWNNTFLNGSSIFCILPVVSRQQLQATSFLSPWVFFINFQAQGRAWYDNRDKASGDGNSALQIALIRSRTGSAEHGTLEKGQNLSELRTPGVGVKKIAKGGNEGISGYCASVEEGLERERCISASLTALEKAML